VAESLERSLFQFISNLANKNGKTKKILNLSSREDPVPDLLKVCKLFFPKTKSPKMISSI
jgi:hypothetical protein